MNRLPDGRGRMLVRRGPLGERAPMPVLHPDPDRLCPPWAAGDLLASGIRRLEDVRRRPGAGEAASGGGTRGRDPDARTGDPDASTVPRRAAPRPGHAIVRHGFLKPRSIVHGRAPRRRVGIAFDVSASHPTPPIAEVADFCTRCGLARLSLLGSVLREDFSANGDIDVLVEFHPGKSPGFIAFAGMRMALSRILGRTVDLKTPADLSGLFPRRGAARGATAACRVMPAPTSPYHPVRDLRQRRHPA